MRTLLLFDDRQGVLGPLTDLRASFDVRTGAFTTAQRWSAAEGLSLRGVIAPTRLAEVVGEIDPDRAVNPSLPLDQRVLLVNGRCPLVLRSVLELAPAHWVRERESGHVVAADVTIAEAAAFLGEGVLPKGQVVEEHKRVLMSRPWQVRSSRDECLRWDLTSFEGRESQATPAGVTRFGEHPVHLARSAKVYPGVVIDSEGGPVVVDENATVRPGAMLIGPVYVGPHSTVLERATLRPGTAVGPWCKVNGEIGGTIFQGYANKAHDGYLGDSWVGEWANLGAGTTNSNLLNTYGEVISRAEPEGRNERTGEQFLGATIGDHVKTAICTRIMTGAVLSTGGMFASNAPVSGCTVRFAWVTDAGSRTYRPDKFLEVMVAAMARRKVTPSDAYVNAVMELQGPAAP